MSAKVDTMQETDPEDYENGAPLARVHGLQVTAEPEYDATTITLEEWKARNEN